MRRLEDVGKKELLEFLSKGWMTHDAMWFYHCLQRYGIEKTNELNLGAIESLAAIEVKRMKKLLGLDEDTPWTFPLFKEFMHGINEIMMPDFMRFKYDFPEENRLYVSYENEKCFAYVGIKSLGVIDRYRCGVFYRLECWYRCLGLDFTIDPQVEGCMMYTDGQCYRDYTFHL